MIKRSKDAGLFRHAVAPYPELVSDDFDFDRWIDNDDNVMMTEGDDVGLFTFEYPGVYNGHYFFVRKGREAADLARRMLNEIFSEYRARTINGMTPVGNRAALWMNRHLGFRPYGTYVSSAGEFELFCITLDQFYEHNKGKLPDNEDVN